MASNPPFQLEDQTDKDFFDKLVNEDDDFKVTPLSGPCFTDGNDSDEAKALANLSIGEVGTGFKDSNAEGGTEAKGKAIGDDVKDVSVDNHVEENNSSVVSSNNDGDGCIGMETVLDSTARKSTGSTVSGVKEVQWSAFNADSTQDGDNGFGSYSDFLGELGDGAVDLIGNAGSHLNSESKSLFGNEAKESASFGNSYNYMPQQEGQYYGADTKQITDGQDLNSSQYWENLYPGWKYDTNTSQWYQVDGYDATSNVQGSIDSNSSADWTVSDRKSEVSYLQQSTQSIMGTVAESGRTESIANWNQVLQASDTTNGVSNWNQVSQESETADSASNLNQVSQGNDGYPSHMVFDPQYPGWYYDTIAQEWRTLDNYTSSAQSTVQAHEYLNQNGFASTGTLSHEKNKITFGELGHVDNYPSEGFNSQGQDYGWTGSFNDYNQQGLNVWQPDTVAKSDVASEIGGNQQIENHYGPKFSVNHASQQKSYDYTGTVPFYEKVSRGHNDFSEFAGSRGFHHGGNFSQQFSQTRKEENEHMHVSNDYYGNQKSGDFTRQPFQNGYQFSGGRSSAGRPPHALVSFGFGGKLILMKNNGSLGNLSYGSQNPIGGSISMLKLTEIVSVKADASTFGEGVCDYFHTLCRQSLPGPLTGGNVGSKELNKWIDERIAQCGSHDMDYRKGEALRLLLSLLKIACQHYGKLRSPFGTDSALKESDVPESAAVARLFATAKRNGADHNEFGTLTRCLQKMPSEGQMQATATEVQSLLVSGRKKEALQCAQEGHLWGPALVLAAQLGDQFYADTVKQMALHQLVAGSPLRTLCLLIAGQPAEVFSTDTIADSGIHGAVNMSRQPSQLGSNGMLDDWEENLAVITANRTKDDELVLIHLGDCMWKERSEIIAAHICYLVAEANFEPYSDSARLCLLGADHWKFPRTFATPEAIQRTEIYEYSKVLGNSQFILLSFQPYKLIYAHMLAEVGRVSDSLKYCQAISKSLKTGRTPEVETWRQLVSSLEERIRTHQQGGFSTNLAPAKLVGKLLNLFDATAHRVVGGLPPPVPSTSVGTVQGDEYNHQCTVPRVSTSQSTMAMSSLIPSASMEPIREWAADGSRRTMHNRSVSEPDFGRSPRQDRVDSSKEATSANGQGKASVSGGTSRFGRFGFGSHLIQKTVGLVLKPRQDQQAKLGEKNKFYYDEKLKRWTEEGAEPPAEELAPLPPPPTAAFQNGVSDYSLKNALKSEVSFSNGNSEFKSPTSTEHSSGIPPIPPSSNQFSARGRMGVRSRYVDTFNQGALKPTNLFQSPSIPSIKTATGVNPIFFVPTPVSSIEQPVNIAADSMQESAATNETPSISTRNNSFQSPTPLTMQRFGSMDNISNKGITTGNGSLSSHSRRTASWSGSFSDAFNSSNRAELKPLGEVLGMPPSSFIPSDPSLIHLSTNAAKFSDELHEVEL